MFLSSRRFFINLILCVTLLSINVWSSSSSQSTAVQRKRGTPFVTLQSSGVTVERSGAGFARNTFKFTLYEGKGSLVIIDSDGKQSARFPTYPILSPAILSSGNIVVASPVGNTFLHIYNSAGRLLKSFGKIWCSKLI
jgi:hypothetical protein